MVYFQALINVLVENHVLQRALISLI